MEQRPSGGFAAAILLGEVWEGAVEAPSHESPWR